jgi:serine/threonine protein kinase
MPAMIQSLLISATIAVSSLCHALEIGSVWKKDDRSYRVTRELGEGASGKAYAAIDLQSRKEVVLKELKETPGFFEFKKRRELSQRSMHVQQLVASAKGVLHQELDAGFFASEGQRRKYLWVTEKMDGDLSLLAGELRLEHRPSNAQQRAQSLLFIADRLHQGVAVLRAEGYTHNDLRSENIFFRADSGEVKLADFEKMTRIGVEVPVFWSNTAAPELLWKSISSHQSDLFSIGATLYSLAFGIEPINDFLSDIERREKRGIPKVGAVQRGAYRYQPEEFQVFIAKRLDRLAQKLGNDSAVNELTQVIFSLLEIDERKRSFPVLKHLPEKPGFAESNTALLWGCANSFFPKYLN